MMPMVSRKSSTGMPLSTWMFLKTVSAICACAVPPVCAANAALITQAKAMAAGKTCFMERKSKPSGTN